MRTIISEGSSVSLPEKHISGAQLPRDTRFAVEAEKPGIGPFHTSGQDAGTRLQSIQRPEEGVGTVVLYHSPQHPAWATKATGAIPTARGSPPAQTDTVGEQQTAAYRASPTVHPGGT